MAERGSEIDCGICMQIFDPNERVPKVLVCGHTLCLVCLNGIQQRHPNKNYLECPFCKAQLPYCNSQQIITNYVVLQENKKDPETEIIQQKETISLMVILNNNNKVTIEISPQSTIKQLCNEITSLDGTQFQLLCNGKEISGFPQKTLKQMGIKDKNRIQCMVKTRGGAL